MVTSTGTELRPSTAGKRRVHHGTLTKKLLRDMGHSAMQFLAMLLLCAMGTWVFSGLDATWRMLDLSTETYVEDGRLADFWVKGAAFTRQDLVQLKNVAGVADIQARVSVEMDCPDLPGDVSLAVNAFDGDIRICTPILREGEALVASDLRGCLLEEQFARAHRLEVGDSITVSFQGLRQTFTIRGIILSSEYLITSKQLLPEPEIYGFMYISSRAVSHLPYTEVLIDLEDGADSDAVQSAISAIVPSALVLTQAAHGSTSTARSYVSIFKGLSILFPLMVYAIAAMIVVSTLTRMIENQRTQIGTLKALGYRDGQIRRHYLSYALAPSLVGSFLGMLVGQVTLPYVIWKIVATNMRYPYQLHAPISPLTWGMTVLSVVLCLLICLRTYGKAAKETTASLLRPKPPRSGSRILLERIPALWSRFSFNTKMIIRNLLRNKGRTFMTIVGILCCNMLIICSFGLQGSIQYFITQYYHGTLQYDLRVELKSGQAGTLDSYRARLDAETVDGVMDQAVSLRTSTHCRSCLLTVLTEDQQTLYLNEDQSLLAMPESGVVVSRKLAELVNAQVGDEVELWLTGDDEPLRVRIEAFADTYIGQGVFMGKTAWEHQRKGKFTPTALLVAGPSEACRHLIDEMDEKSEILYPPEQLEQTMHIMDSTATAFSILSGAALALAFIICYNMGLMNFTERTRDYATLKVLGYHQREIRRLMLRENNYTAILGVVLGIPPGVMLVKVILDMCEYDSMVFVAHVTVGNVALACAISYVFSFFIQGLLTRKVKTIDMVEALKSVE